MICSGTDSESKGQTGPAESPDPTKPGPIPTQILTDTPGSRAVRLLQ